MTCKVQGLKKLYCGTEDIDFAEDDILAQLVDFVREELTEGRIAQRRASPGFTITVYPPEDQKIGDFMAKCGDDWLMVLNNGRQFGFPQGGVIVDANAYDVQTGKLPIQVISDRIIELVGQGTNANTTAQAA